MEQAEGVCKIPSCDDYFKTIQAQKRLPDSLQESLTSAFAQIPASSFPEVPGGKVIEIPGDTTVLDAVRILSEYNIMAAPVCHSDLEVGSEWHERYLGVVDYSAIVLWVLENAELAAVALTAGTATAVGVGTGTLAAIGALALGAAAPAVVAGASVTAAGAAAAGKMTAQRDAAEDSTSASDIVGDDFYGTLLQNEPLKSTKVESIVEPYKSAPFIPVTPDSPMLTVLLLLSKYRLRNVPVIDIGKPNIKNFITQTAVVKGLQECRGRDWFDYIAALPLSDFGLPFMLYDKVIHVKGEDTIFEAFKIMRDNRIGGLPVLDGSTKRLVGGISIRDIRFLLLRADIFSNFRHLSVMDFIRTIGSAFSEPGLGLIKPPLTCAPDATLGSVIDNLASRPTHRIYVVDGADREVVGVVTLRDVISCFIDEPPGYFDKYMETSDSEERPEDNFAMT